MLCLTETIKGEVMCVPVYLTLANRYLLKGRRAGAQHFWRWSNSKIHKVTVALFNLDWTLSGAIPEKKTAILGHITRHIKKHYGFGDQNSV